MGRPAELADRTNPLEPVTAAHQQVRVAGECRWIATHIRDSSGPRASKGRYLLLRSGRLIITPAGESRAIVMDNVPNINHVEDGVKAILGVTEVSFRQRDATLR